MKFVNIMGSIDDIDRIIEKYIYKYEIQLEYAIKEVADSQKLTVCYDKNPYTEYLDKAKKFLNMVDGRCSAAKTMGEEEALKLIGQVSGFWEKRDGSIRELETKRDAAMEILEKIEPFANMNFSIRAVKGLRFIKYRFGKMPVSNFKQFESYVYSHGDMIFAEGKKDEDYVYGAYFIPDAAESGTDTVLSSLNFQRIKIPFDLDGAEIGETPFEASRMLSEKVRGLKEAISLSQSETIFTLGINKQDIADAYITIKDLYERYELRKYAAQAPNGFYMFMGWMPQGQCRLLEKAISSDKKAIFVVEDEKGSIRSKPPTKLNNNLIFRPFEFFVRTYGLPQYNEIDPTAFVAITYIFLFGMMFGDLGQGAVVSLLGMYLKKVKKLELGGVMTIIGISSMFFGLLYGSIFGLEDVIPAIWMRPYENITDILIIAVGIGVGLVFTAMVMNMVNAVKAKDTARLLLGPNGAAGIVFYTAAITIGLSVFYGRGKAAAWLVFLFIAIPMIVIAFREPIGKYLKNRKKAVIEGSLAMFFLETFIELFEVLLTYFTNTVSFVRVGAFALSHAGMMSVVLLLAENGKGFNLPVMILGNILVMAMEGLVVGIQVLRIEFYELFSRYYQGGGREFIPTVKNDL